MPRKKKRLSIKERMERGRKLLDTEPNPPVEATKKIINAPHHKSMIIKPHPKEEKKAYSSDLTPEEMLQVDIIEFAWELRTRRNLSCAAIAKELQEKYDLPTIPTHHTVMIWLKKSWAFRTDNIAKFEEELKNDIYGQQQQIIRRWLPVALGEDIQILRRKIVNGEEVEYLDEDASDEQMKAAELVIKAHAQICKTIGIEKPQFDGGELNEKKLLQIVMNVNQFIAPPQPNGRPIDIGVKEERLELSAGIPEIDGL